MRLRDIASWTPLDWILISVAALCVAAAAATIGGGLGFRWDPFDTVEKRAERAEGQLQATRSDRDARSAEAAGARATTQLVEQAAADRAAATDIVNRYALEQETDPHEPTADPDDGGDLRDVIGELCGLRSAVCASHARPAAPGDARDGPRRVPDPRASR